LLAESKCVDIILYCQYHNHASYIKGSKLIMSLKLPLGMNLSLFFLFF